MKLLPVSFSLGPPGYSPGGHFFITNFPAVCPFVLF
jgi:hypothetical protein